MKADNVIAMGTAHQLCSLSIPLRYLVSELALQLEVLGAPLRGISFTR